jgi:hypothetical protein
MSDIDRTLDLAKNNRLSRAELYWRMEALAAQQREPGQSQAQAFAKFVSGEGRELMMVHQSLSAAGSGGIVGDYTSAFQPSASVAKSVVEDDWDRLVKATQKAANCSTSEAIDAALSNEAGRYAFAKRLRSDRIATGEFSQADLEALDGAAAEQQQHREFHKRDLKSEYETECDAVRRMHPDLKESDVHDFARQRNPAAWEDFKMNKLGGKGRQLPRGHVPQPGDEHPTAATSGRTEPSHAPQWTSEHSGNRPGTTPARTPERPSDSPAIKILDDLARNSGLPRTEIAKYLCTVPTGRRLVMLAALER